MRPIVIRSPSSSSRSSTVDSFDQGAVGRAEVGDDEPLSRPGGPRRAAGWRPVSARTMSHPLIRPMVTDRPGQRVRSGPPRSIRASSPGCAGRAPPARPPRRRGTRCAPALDVLGLDQLGLAPELSRARAPVGLERDLGRAEQRPPTLAARPRPRPARSSLARAPSIWGNCSRLPPTAEHVMVRYPHLAHAHGLPASISRSTRLPSSTGCRLDLNALPKKPSTMSLQAALEVAKVRHVAWMAVGARGGSVAQQPEHRRSRRPLRVAQFDPVSFRTIDGTRAGGGIGRRAGSGPSPGNRVGVQVPPRPLPS